MARNSLVTVNDLNALSSYSVQQRAQVLCCYLLNPNRYSMQEVAQEVLCDYNDQAGQRVSLITRSYGFSARNAGRYARAATEQDVWDFVRSHQPERCGGLPEGSFDEFLRARQAQREAERRQEQARLQAQRQQEQARREAEARYQAEQARRRQEEQRHIEEELRRQEEQVRQEMGKKQRAEALSRQAEQRWQNGPGPNMAEGIRLFQEAKTISWQEEWQGYMCTRKLTPTPLYCAACAEMTEYYFDQGNIIQALTYGGYLYESTHMDRDWKSVNYAMLNSEAGHTIGRGYAVLAMIYLDKNRGYFNAEKGQQAKTIISELPGMAEALYHDQTEGLRNLKDLLRKSSITAVNTGDQSPAERRPASKVTRIILDGQEIPVSNTTEALTKTYGHYLCGERPVPTPVVLVEKLSALCFEGQRENSVFRSHTTIQAGGESLWLGLSSSSNSKLKHVHQLLRDTASCPTTPSLPPPRVLIRRTARASPSGVDLISGPRRYYFLLVTKMRRDRFYHSFVLY